MRNILNKSVIVLILLLLINSCNKKNNEEYKVEKCISKKEMTKNEFDERWRYPENTREILDYPFTYFNKIQYGNINLELSYEHDGFEEKPLADNDSSIMEIRFSFPIIHLNERAHISIYKENDKQYLTIKKKCGNQYFFGDINYYCKFKIDKEEFNNIFLLVDSLRIWNIFIDSFPLSEYHGGSRWFFEINKKGRYHYFYMMGADIINKEKYKNHKFTFYNEMKKVNLLGRQIFYIWRRERHLLEWEFNFLTLENIKRDKKYFEEYDEIKNMNIEAK